MIVIKNIIKCTLFLLLFIIGWNNIFKVLNVKKNSIGYFYEEPKNSLDIVYIGSSNANTSFNTVLAYNLYGFTTGMLSTESQSFINTKYLIEESEKYQNPKLYIIDISNLATDFRYLEDGCRKTFDSMKFSKNKIDMINESLLYANIPKEKYLSYYFKFLLYHNQWKNVDITNFKNYENNWDIYYKGFLFNSFTAEINPQEEFELTDESFELQENNKNVLLNLIDYIKEKNLNVIFVLPNRKYWYPEIQMLNDSIDIIRNSGFKAINFNILNNFKIDNQQDLYNETHMNIYGSTKYTLYFSKYLDETYDLPDHRNNSKYSSWDKEYKKFTEDFKNITEIDFNDILKNYIKYYSKIEFKDIDNIK